MKCTHLMNWLVRFVKARATRHTIRDAVGSCTSSRSPAITRKFLVAKTCSATTTCRITGTAILRCVRGSRSCRTRSAFKAMSLRERHETALVLRRTRRADSSSLQRRAGLNKSTQMHRAREVAAILIEFWPARSDQGRTRILRKWLHLIANL